MNLADHRAVLKRVAVVLVLYAFVEGAVFAYCVANRINFSSSIGISGLLAGFFLWRGSLRAAAFVHRVALFLLGLVLPVLLVVPWLFPLDLLLTVCRLRPIAALVVGGYTLVLLALCWWAARELGRESVGTARTALGRNLIDRRYPFSIGAALGLAAALVVWLTLNGRAATEAEQQAAQRYGPAFRYRTIGLRGLYFIDDSVVFVTVAMWNDSEFKVIEGPMSVR